MSIHFLQAVRPNDPLRQILTEDAFAVRKVVFQDERGLTAKQDRDAMDERAIQIVGYSREVTSYNSGLPGVPMFLPTSIPVAAARVVATDDGFKIGRICVLHKQRGNQIGRALMKHTLDLIQDMNPRARIYLHSLDDERQGLVSVGFYQKLGFVPEGEPFLRGILWHREMVYSPSQHTLSYDPENDVLVRSMRDVGASEEVVQSAIATTTPENFVPDSY